MHDAKHGYVGLSRSRGRADEHVLAAEQRRVAHGALHSVEAVHALEGRLGPLWELLDGAQLLARLEGLGLEVRDMDHIIALVGGPVWKKEGQFQATIQTLKPLRSYF